MTRASHHVVHAPQPSRPDIEEAGPSVVIDPQAEVPVATAATRPKKVAETTLVIRDKHQVDDLWAQVHRIGRLKKWRRVRTMLLWGGASAAAFGFGTAVAFFAASGPSASAEKSPAARSAEGQVGVTPASSKKRVADGLAPEPAARGTAPQPAATVLSLAELGDATELEDEAPAVQERTQAASSAQPSSNSLAGDSSGRVVSLDDL